MNSIKNSPEDIINNNNNDLKLLLDERTRLDSLRENESSVIKRMNLSKQIKNLDKKIMKNTPILKYK